MQLDPERQQEHREAYQGWQEQLARGWRSLGLGEAEDPFAKVG